MNTHPHMPPRAPLAMATQDLRATVPVRHCVSGGPSHRAIGRLVVFVTALVGTFALTAGLYNWLSFGGMTWLEWVLLALIGLSFIWISLSVATVLVGFAGLARAARKPPPPGPPLDVAILVPICDEPASDVFGNAAAMLNDLARTGGGHRFTLYVLSDSRNAATAMQELQAFAALSAVAPLPVFYRHRIENTDKKIGNIKDWVCGWGAAHDAMLVLDADSLMAGRTIGALADEMATDPDAGLIQSFPLLIGAETLFARIQQFSNIAYGWLQAEGLAWLSRTEGNYWGHNAIIRTPAFAASAGLPKLPGGHLIMSHDFVEAGLLRRAGWRVRFLPRLTGSFEETPGTLIDHVRRDQRWCRGNLQHLRLLATPGLHIVSRFHMLQGAVSYLLAPAWLALLVIWTLLGRSAQVNIISYFSPDNPLYPSWPVMNHMNSAAFLLIMYGVLLTPKVLGAAVIAFHPKAHRPFGGRSAFLSAFLTEVVLSVLYAPVLMIQQCRAVLASALRRPQKWAPQRRRASAYPFWVLLRFHWIETVLGLALSWLLVVGLVSPWLTPIAVSLVAAVPLSALSAMPVTGRRTPAALRLDSPFTLREPAIVRRAQVERQRLREMLAVEASVPVE